MELGLRGKTVLVTGASKGIGLAVAKGFAEEGCDLYLVSRTAADLETAAQVIRQAHSVDVAVHPLDLSQAGAAEWSHGTLERQLQAGAGVAGCGAG